MQETNENIWNFYNKGRIIVVPTNGTTRKDGAAVMGRGIAQQAAIEIPALPYRLGELLMTMGNIVYAFEDIRIITFPVKANWREQADLNLIETSLKQLVHYVNTPAKHGKFYIPRVGCGNGKLAWSDVYSLMKEYLDNRFVIVYDGS